jgi:hypothetical protein
MLALLAVLPGLAGAEDPFPFERSVTLQDEGASYVVRGRAMIPPGARVKAIRHMTVRGEGAGAALVIDGSLELESVLRGRIVLQDLWLELTPRTSELRLSQVDVRGAGGIRSAPASSEGEPAPTTAARVFLEDVTLPGGACFDVRAHSGDFDFRSVSFGGTLRVFGESQSDKKGNQTTLELLSCRGLSGGLAIENVREVLVRNCRIGGTETLFRNWHALTFDGNLVRSKRFELRQPYPRMYKRTAVKNTDFSCEELLVFSPREGDKVEKLVLERCWFDGMTDEDTILERLIRDAGDDERNGLEVRLERTSEHAIGLGGS